LQPPPGGGSPTRGASAGAHTFVVRVRIESRGGTDRPALWRATVQHLPSGRTRSATTLEEISGFLAGYLDPHDP
jgi:hypothetical protein